MPLSASAAGVTVSPAFQNVVITPDMAGKDITVTLTNQSTIGINFALSVADFGTLDQSGGVAFLGTPATELEHRYGLVSWMKLDQDRVFIPATGSKIITISIDNRPSLAPGGHYAALLATAISDADNAPVDKRVKLRQVISSLILLRKEGGVEAGLKLKTLNPIGGHVFKLPQVVDLRFQASGNVHVVPHGTIVIKNPNGKVVSQGTINEDSAIVYPQSFRKMTTSLINTGSNLVPGKYELTATYRYDSDLSLGTQTISFWYLGNALTAGLFALILTILGGVVWLVRKKLRRS